MRHLQLIHRHFARLLLETVSLRKFLRGRIVRFWACGCYRRIFDVRCHKEKSPYMSPLHGRCALPLRAFPRFWRRRPNRKQSDILAALKSNGQPGFQSKQCLTHYPLRTDGRRSNVRRSDHPPKCRQVPNVVEPGGRPREFVEYCRGRRLRAVRFPSFGKYA